MLSDVVQKGEAKDLQKLVQKLPENEKFNILKKVRSKAGVKLLQAQSANMQGALLKSADV